MKLSTLNMEKHYTISYEHPIERSTVLIFMIIFLFILVATFLQALGFICPFTLLMLLSSWEYVFILTR